LPVQIFDYIHSVDSEKLAKKIAHEQNKINKKIKIFLQVNIGDENQKSGVNKNNVSNLASILQRHWFGFNWFNVYSSLKYRSRDLL
jgi:uncharacterized pyridoxal phosphate-containing UPF0001 family protein